MKSRKLVALNFLIGFFILLVYLILAARPLGKEFQFEPEWKISVSSPVISENKTDEKIYFKLGQSLGYFTEKGEVTNFVTFPSMAAVSDNFYSIYNSNASNLEIFNSDGTKSGTITIPGYPYFSDKASFVFLPGGNSFANISSNGTVNWLDESTIPITAFSSSGDYSVAGYADGKISLFNNLTGENESNYNPGGSDYPVILGIDISSDGNYIGSISGHEKQRFVLSKKENQQQKIIFHYFIDESTPYQTLVHFTKDNNRVLYIYLNKIGLYDIQNEKNYTLPVSDRIIKIEESDDLIFLLGKTKKKYTVYMIDKTNTMEGKFSFEASSAFIRVYNNNLYIGKDTSISKIALKRD